MEQPAHHESEVEPGATPSPMDALLQKVDFSFTEQLDADPDERADGRDHRPRQVRSGHFVPVAPTPIAAPEYVSHSHALFSELGLGDELAKDEGLLEHECLAESEMGFRRAVVATLQADTQCFRFLGGP